MKDVDKSAKFNLHASDGEYCTNSMSIINNGQLQIEKS